jgi:centrin-1
MEQQEIQIKEAFELFDTDGGGTMDSRELHIAMCAMGFQSTKINRKARQQASQKMFEALDTDQTNSICLDEFTALMKGELTLLDPVEEIRAIFAGLCRLEDSDPCLVGLSKLRLASKAYNVRLSEREFLMMLEDVDHDCSGFVDEAEFMRVMSLSPWF